MITSIEKITTKKWLNFTTLGVKRIMTLKLDGIILQATNMEDWINMDKAGEITLETLLELLGGYV
jgi:hypothetical protein